jgi:hypothetical protein
MYLPVNYDKITTIAGTYTPNTVIPCDNKSYDYWFRSLFQRAQSVIRIDNTPSNWDVNVYNFLFWCLFKDGYVAVFHNNKFGDCFQPCALSGFDFYYQFTDAIISNPKLKVTLNIHKECEILKLSPDYIGIWDILDRYARRLSNLDPAIDMAIDNSKFSNIYGARNKSGANFLKKVLDFVKRGEPAVVADTSFLLPLDKVTKEDIVVDLSRKDIKNTYLGTELLQDFATIVNEFDTEIGIPTLPYQKKERMVTDEAQSKQADATSRSHVWVDTMNRCFVDINRMLGTNMVAVHNYDEVEKGGGEDNE